jgi:Diacylglycerol kinase catalytic domain
VAIRRLIQGLIVAIDSGKPASLAVISNPLAGRNRGGLEELERALQGMVDARHYLASTPDEVENVVDQLVQQPADVVAINGGDGTVSLVMTLMLGRQWPVFPVIALIAGGTTNMTAADIGLAGKPVVAIKGLRRWCASPDVMKLYRRAMLCLRADNRQAHYGFFMGAGLISRGVALSLEKRARARRPEWVPPLLTVSLLIKLLLGKRPLGDPIHMEIHNGADIPRQGAFEAVYVAALETLLLGFRPLPGSMAETGFQWGALEAGIPAPGRTLPAFLRGRQHPLVCPERGFHREAGERLTLRYQGDYMVDGEFYPVDSELQITATEPITLLNL